METGLSLRFLQQKRLNTKESRLDQLLEIIRIKWEVLNNVFLGIQRTCVVVRQIRVILDLVIEILFVDGLQEHAHADAREFHEFSVLAVSSVRSEDDNVGLWIIALDPESKMYNRYKYLPIIVQFDQLLYVGLYHKHAIRTVLLLDVQLVFEVLAGTVDRLDAIVVIGELGLQNEICMFSLTMDNVKQPVRRRR